MKHILLTTIAGVVLVAHTTLAAATSSQRKTRTSASQCGFDKY
ncbi:uncharacterized protein METZ01_LOCUS289733 [marine metagenome]|uniref:Uncharacterized protein n=1 Tax=marine metagenome TaxID=408172 RepID=A0A382LJK0_9ZZZZ